jgi:hypothetical protein
VYSHIITNGVFPFQLELNTQNLRVYENRFYNFFVPDEISPWSPKYHCSIIVSNFRYSFTPNDLMNINLQNERRYSRNFRFNQLRVLDFFPLDAWIDEIAQYVYSIMQNLVSYDLPGTEIKPFQSSYHGYETLTKEEEESFAIIRQMFRHRFQEKYKVTKMKMHGQKFLNFFDDVLGECQIAQQITSTISEEFYQLYKEELFGKQRLCILDNICKIIASTEFSRYDKCSNNC